MDADTVHGEGHPDLLWRAIRPQGTLRGPGGGLGGGLDAGFAFGCIV